MERVFVESDISTCMELATLRMGAIVNTLNSRAHRLHPRGVISMSTSTSTV